jgi:hypothetical protein
VGGIPPFSLVTPSKLHGVITQRTTIQLHSHENPRSQILYYQYLKGNRGPSFCLTAVMTSSSFNLNVQRMAVLLSPCTHQGQRTNSRSFLTLATRCRSHTGCGSPSPIGYVARCALELVQDTELRGKILCHCHGLNPGRPVSSQTVYAY